MIHRGRLFAPRPRVPATQALVAVESCPIARSPANAVSACGAVARARMLARVSALDADFQPELEHVRAPVAAPASPELERAPGAELASSVGNRAFGNVVSRMQDGEAILPSGVAHPAIESA